MRGQHLSETELTQYRLKVLEDHFASMDAKLDQINDSVVALNTKSAAWSSLWGSIMGCLFGMVGSFLTSGFKKS